MATEKWYAWAWTFAVLALIVYYFLDPLQSALFPKCPFYTLTGFKCPGCGSQRALHALLHLRIGKAFTENPLLVISLPYLLIALGLFLKKRMGKPCTYLEDLLFRGNAVKVVLLVVLGFWLLRNLL